jgi:hypothetical protein
MPNLQELVPFFQKLLEQWYQFTLNNSAYATSLALLVWLLTAIAYSITIAFLNRRINLERKAGREIQANLDAAQQQLQALQEQLTQNAAQLADTTQLAENEGKRANDFEQRLNLNNRQLVDGLSNLVNSFELIEQLPDAGAAPETLWLRYSAIVERITERFRNEQQAKARLQLDVQAEKSKAAEKDMLANNLQSRLDSQTEQLAKLELAMDEQQTLRQELEGVKQQLIDAQIKNRNDFARIAELERQSHAAPVIPTAASAPVATIPEQAVYQEPAIKPADAVRVAEVAPVEIKPVVTEITLPEPPKPIATVSEPKISETSKVAETKAAAPKAVAKEAKWKGLIGNAMQKFSKLDEKLGSPGTNKVQLMENVEEQQPDAIDEITLVEPAVQLPDAQAPESEKKPAANVSGKLGGLLGALKKTQEKLAETAPQQAPVIAPVIASSEGAAKKTAGKLGGLLGKFKKG